MVALVCQVAMADGYQDSAFHGRLPSRVFVMRPQPLWHVQVLRGTSTGGQGEGEIRPFGRTSKETRLLAGTWRTSCA